MSGTVVATRVAARRVAPFLVAGVVAVVAVVAPGAPQLAAPASKPAS